MERTDQNKGTAGGMLRTSGLRIFNIIRIHVISSAVIIAAAVIISAAVFMLISGKILVVRMYNFPVYIGKDPEMGKAGIVALADLHGKMIGENQEKLVSKIACTNPDLIVYLGDMVDRDRPEESMHDLLILTKKLRSLAPVYYVEGNHELEIKSRNPEVYNRLNSELGKAGAVRLENSITTVYIGENRTDFQEDRPDVFKELPGDVPKKTKQEIPKGAVINLCGITTHYYWGEEENKLVDDLCKMEGTNILLCHYPESVLWYHAFEGGGLDCALCGHTHGGLIRLPLIGGLYSPEQGWLPMYDLGAYPIYSDTDSKSFGGGKGSEYLGTMIISGGLAGEHGLPRVNNPMEISLIEID